MIRTAICWRRASLQINVEATPQEAAREAFVESIAADDFNWFANTIDWDGDGVANPYDWTPTVNGDGMTINLTLGADGSAENPWPIYNVWQLQAIADVSVAMNGTLSEGLALFGDGDNLTAHYRLAADIDATPTRGWNDGNGFNPIGIHQQIDAIEFKGSFDGKGRVIRGLYANLHVDGGLFYSIARRGRVSRLGLPDVDIRSHGVNNTNERNTGALAHLLSGKVSLVWATGEVVADDGKGRVGGLVRGVGNTGESTSGDMRESWFVGKVRGETSVGGLVGFGARGNISDSWAMARVESSETRGGNIGGLIGFAFGGFSLARSWSGGWRDTNANAHALIGKDRLSVQGNNYFDRAISQSGVLVNRKCDSGGYDSDGESRRCRLVACGVEFRRHSCFRRQRRRIIRFCRESRIFGRGCKRPLSPIFKRKSFPSPEEWNCRRMATRR